MLRVVLFVLSAASLCFAAPKSFDFNAMLDSSNPFVVQAQALPDPRQQQQPQQFAAAASDVRPTVVSPDAAAAANLQRK